LILFSNVPAELKPTERTIQCVRISGKINIDGFLDEAAWLAGKPESNFLQTDPDEGVPGTEKTSVTVLYDDQALYIGFVCFDKEPEKIIKILSKRDDWTSTDKVQVEIDSYHDHLTGYFFEVNAAGVQRDGFRSSDHHYDMSWNSVWEAEAKTGPEGWSAEYRIPFSCLRFNDADEMTWGINFGRWIIRKKEYDIWNFKPQSISGDIAHYGHLEPLVDVAPQRHLEVLPYAVSSRNTGDKSPGNPDGIDIYSNIGLDVKYGLTSNLTLDAAFNPDFGQVESDPALVNLSTFETFYEERRPFFIEGASSFRTQFDLFYSRRIGRSPRDEPGDLDYYINRPKGTTILGAAKLTGKTSNGWNLAFLEALTDKEYATYMGTDGLKHRAVVEDLANYQVSRVSREFSSGSSIGAMSTMVHQRNKYSSYTGGLDWDLFFSNRSYEVAGQVVGSRMGPGENGAGMLLAAEKSGGKHIRGSFGIEYQSEELDLNRLGFLRRANYLGGWAWMQYRTTDDLWIVRNSYNNINFWIGENLQGDLISHGCNFNNSIEFTNGWWTGFGFAPDFPHYDDRETRGGPLYRLPYTWAAWIWMETNNRHPVVVNIDPSFGTDRDGRWANAHLYVEVKPRQNIRFSIGPGLRTSDNISRWVLDDVDANGERIDVFGELDYREVNVNFRSTITFTKNMTLQLYSQVFVGSGDYSNFKQFVPPDRFKVLTIPYNENPDFNFKSFNLNAVFRWEYTPGSDLYLVWTQDRDKSDEYGDFDLGRDVNDVFYQLSENAFLVKINYWWNP
jgi:hypothetical protein